MCKPASFVVTKDRVFWSTETDSHSEIIAEFNLCESIGNASAATMRPCVAKVEITPPDMPDGSRPMFEAPLDQWTYMLDENIAPEWYNAETVEAMVRAELPKWLAARVVLPGQSIEVNDQRNIVCALGAVTAYGSATVTAYDSATAMACDRATVTAYDRATVTACGSATVTAYGSATVTAYDSATVTAYDSATAMACDSATAMACGSATVQIYSKYAKVSAPKDRAIVIDRSGDKIVIRGNFEIAP